jgi:hypothetical protein
MASEELKGPDRLTAFAIFSIMPSSVSIVLVFLVVVAAIRLGLS